MPSLLDSPSADSLRQMDDLKRADRGEVSILVATLFQPLSDDRVFAPDTSRSGAMLKRSATLRQTTGFPTQHHFGSLGARDPPPKVPAIDSLRALPSVSGRIIPDFYPRHPLFQCHIDGLTPVPDVGL